MKYVVSLLVLVGVLSFSTESHAAWFRLKRTPVSRTTTTKVVATTTSSSGSLYDICLRKANIQASRGRCHHPGGSFGGCHYEGVGAAMTASAALSNCCYTGVRKCAASAVVKGKNGMYYACKLFW